MNFSNKVKTYYGFDIYELTEEEGEKLHPVNSCKETTIRSFYPDKTFVVFEKGENLETTNPRLVRRTLTDATDYCRKFARAPIGNRRLKEEELKNLPLHSWVWIEVLQPFSFEEKVSAYYRKQTDYTHNQAFCCGYPGIGFSFYYGEYNITWTAYLYEPKENEE